MPMTSSSRVPRKAAVLSLRYETLAKAKEARALHTQLDGMGLSTEIAQNMFKYAKFGEDKYKTMRDLTVGTTEKTFDTKAFKKEENDF